MKVILTQDVPTLGRKFDVKNVSDGYATNRLFPQGLAREVTTSTLKQAEAERARSEAERTVREDLLLKNIGALERKTVHIAATANEQGHLFASVHAGDIAKQLTQEIHIDVLPECIDLAHPLKTVGEHKLSVSIQGKKTAFTVVIEKSIGEHKD